MYARRAGVKLTVTAMCIALLAGVGCSNDNHTGPTTEDFNKERERLAAEAKNAPAKPKPPPAKPAPAPSVVAEETGLGLIAGDFRYEAEGKRDPFRSFEWERPDRIDDSELRGPLEQFDVSQLSLVAVVWDTGNARALIQDPSGQSYIIGEGTRIGKNEGHVIEISDNLVVVKETYVDFLGQETTKDIEMRIRSSQGG